MSRVYDKIKEAKFKKMEKKQQGKSRKANGNINARGTNGRKVLMS